MVDKPSYSLKFLSGEYQGGEFALPESDEIIIGRATDLDMVMMEDMVSRRHAKIVCRHGEIYIEDLGSTNGTFVNGEKITRVRLKPGDRILIGKSILKLINRTDSAHSRMKSLPRANKVAGSSSVETSLTGRLEDISLPDLLQLLSASRKDGVLVIKSGGERGSIVLKEGKVIYCGITRKEHIDSRKAFYRLLTWDQGTFELQKRTQDLPEDQIPESTQALLMEGVRQLDELKHIKHELPATTEILGLEAPILPPLRSLTPELLDTLQLVHNLGTVQAVLDQSAASDLDTYQELLYLLRHRYIRRISKAR